MNWLEEKGNNVWGGVSPPEDRKEITVDRWVKIIEKPYCNPEDRLREFMDLDVYKRQEPLITAVCGFLCLTCLV